MNNVQKMGGFAALYLAVAYAIGIPLFLVVWDYPHIVEPAQKVALMVMAVWLIVKGFNASAIAPGSAKTVTNEPLGAT